MIDADVVNRAEIHMMRQQLLNSGFRDLLGRCNPPVNYRDAKRLVDEFNRRNQTEMGLVDVFIATLDVDLAANTLGVREDVDQVDCVVAGILAFRDLFLQTGATADQDARAELADLALFVGKTVVYLKHQYPASVYDEIDLV